MLKKLGWNLRKRIRLSLSLKKRHALPKKQGIKQRNISVHS